MSHSAVQAVPAKAAVTTWRYHLPNESGEGWAIAFLDSTGVFACESDWSTFGYRWHEGGWGPGDFRQFFVRCDEHYIVRKIARSDTYDGDRTLRNVKEYICERRRHDDWDRNHARAEWELLDRFSKLYSREDFAFWYQETRIESAYELAHYDFSPQTQGFMKYAFPRLQEAIRKQLQDENKIP